VFTPVLIGGVTISRATLHSFPALHALGVCVGDEVRVERRGDVIPQIVSVVSKHSNDDNSAEVEDADVCAVHDLVRVCPCEDRTRLEYDGVHLFCRSPTCPAQRVHRYAYECVCVCMCSFPRTAINGRVYVCMCIGYSISHLERVCTSPD